MHRKSDIYRNKSAVYVCVCVYVSLSVKSRASCDPQNGELKGVHEEIHLASLTV